MTITGPITVLSLLVCVFISVLHNVFLCLLSPHTRRKSWRSPGGSDHSKSSYSIVSCGTAEHGDHRPQRLREDKKRLIQNHFLHPQHVLVFSGISFFFYLFKEQCISVPRQSLLLRSSTQWDLSLCAGFLFFFFLPKQRWNWLPLSLFPVPGLDLFNGSISVVSVATSVDVGHIENELGAGPFTCDSLNGCTPLLVDIYFVFYVKG